MQSMPTYEGHAIPVSYPQKSQWGLLEGGKLSPEMTKGILVLDRERDKIVFGQPSLLSRKLKESQVRLSFGPLAYEDVTVTDNGALLLKKYAVVFKLKEPDSDGWDRWVFWGSRSDVEAFAKACKELRESNVQHFSAVARREGRYELLVESVEADCKSRGKVSLRELARKHHERAKELVDAKLDTEDDALIWVEVIVENAIRDGTLSGIIDEEEMEYVDRDFIVREQRVVNVSVQLDFNNLVQQLGNKGVSLSTIECPQCGGTCTVPESGTAFRCEFCKATVKATDIFEKFKGILG